MALWRKRSLLRLIHKFNSPIHAPDRPWPILSRACLRMLYGRGSSNPKGGNVVSIPFPSNVKVGIIPVFIENETSYCVNTSLFKKLPKPHSRYNIRMNTGMFISRSTIEKFETDFTFFIDRPQALQKIHEPRLAFDYAKELITYWFMNKPEDFVFSEWFDRPMLHSPFIPWST